MRTAEWEIELKPATRDGAENGEAVQVPGKGISKNGRQNDNEEAVREEDNVWKMLREALFNDSVVLKALARFMR